MNHKTEIRLIIPHAESSRRDQPLRAILEKPLFDFLAHTGASKITFHAAPVWQRIDAIMPKPFGDRARVPDCERVNHTGAGKLRNGTRQPAQTGNVAGQM